MLERSDLRGLLCALRGGELGTAEPYEEERLESSSEYDMGAFGNRLLRDGYRPPYVVPEQV